ncbi:MAG: phage major capsid protein [Hyphomicrobiaceae bacterium]
MTHTHLETKAGGQDIATAFEDLIEAFEAFKDTNNRRLSEVERRFSADVVTTDKLDRISRSLDVQQKTVDALVQRATRAASHGPGPGLQDAYAEAFSSYVRKGQDGGLRDLDRKAMSIGTDSDGGYLVPHETETMINSALRDASPIRAIASVRQVTGAVLKKPFAITGQETGWAGETAARPQTTTPTLAELTFPTMELYAMPAATQALLDDAAIDIDLWIADEVRAVFAEQEGKAFVIGDGNNKPRGFMDYPTVAAASWTWGNLATISTGVSGGFAASAPADRLIDLIYAIKAGYRANGTFVMNRKTQAAVRKLKDADGHYLWQPSVSAGSPPTLLGYPVVEAEDMPDIAANANAIAFGDFRRGYLIVDRLGIRMLRDPYSSKPYVLFYTTKRVGGGVQDFDAIKLLRFAA